MREKNEGGSIGGTVIKIYFPTFPLFYTHPGALEGKVSYEVACEPDQERGYRDTKYHVRSPLTYFMLSIVSKGERGNELAHSMDVRYNTLHWQTCLTTPGSFGMDT